jgi:hypothetical protein
MDPESWAIGYHYTSWSNWQRIQQEGLTPTLLSADKIAKTGPKTVEDWDGKAVWIWTERLDPVEHMGSLIYQLAKRNESKLVHLLVWFQDKDRLPHKEDGYRLYLRHTGKIDGFEYHARTQSCLLIATVPPQNIKLLGIYDLVEMLK